MYPDVFLVMIDREVELGVVGYQPTGNLASVHGQDPSWCCFLLHCNSACFGIGFVDKVLGCPIVHQGSGIMFFSIGPL